MKDPAPAWDLLHSAELICSEEEVKAAIGRMASDITLRLGEKYPLVLTVMGGGVFFAGQILPLLRFPLDVDYIHASRYGAETMGASVDWRVVPPESVNGRTVLVLDDILDVGTTMSAIRDRILALGAAEFYCAVLTEKELRKS